jgi:hypothetical protein
VQRGQNTTVKNWDTIAQLVGNTCPVNDTVIEVIGQYRGLCALAENYDPVKRHEISIEQLEMLEAELRNQGITSDNGAVYLAQIASLDRNMLRWRARRSSIVCPELLFSLDIMAYLMRTACELIASLDGTEPDDQTRSRFLWHALISTREQALTQIDYLEQLAFFFDGDESRTSNRFQQGLTLLLRILIKPERREAPENAVQVTLPTTSRELLNLLRGYRKH